MPPERSCGPAAFRADVALCLAAAALLVGAFPACVTPTADAPHAPGPEGPPTTPATSSVPPAPSSASLEPPAPRAHRFAVAAESAVAARVAMDVLERGGNAVDAAIAGVLTSGVTQPVSSGLGGGGFAMIWDAKAKEVRAIDFRETAPVGLKPSEHWRFTEKKRGVWAGVPGEVAGLFAMHARWGKKPIAEDIGAAADVAEKGFAISAHLARALKWNEAWIRHTPGYAMFVPDGGLASVHDTVRSPRLAATLRRIAAEGKAAFYEGAIADDIVSTARRAGGHLTKRELAAYQPQDRAPLHVRWEGSEIYTMPPESGGGLLLLETLRMHEKAKLVALGAGSGSYLHLLAETFRGAVADRVMSIGDPAFVKMDVEKIANAAKLAARRASISLVATKRAERFTLDESGTSHLVVVDEEGNVVSITTTVNGMFGARLLTDSGFVLNDTLADFTKGATEHHFGLRQGSGPNSARGGARPASSMTPTIVVEAGAPVLALGGSGGTKIATATTQVLLARLAFGRTVAEAIADPRVDTPPTGGLTIDPGVPRALLEDLAHRGEVVDATKPSFSAVQAIALGARDGVRFLEAGADARKGGSAIVE